MERTRACEIFSLVAVFLHSVHTIGLRLEKKAKSQACAKNETFHLATGLPGLTAGLPKYENGCRMGRGTGCNLSRPVSILLHCVHSTGGGVTLANF